MSILRQAMDGFLAGQAHKPVMAPFIEHLAARIAGISYQEMTSDAGSWTAALSRTADLLQIEGVIVGGDITLLVEALGGSIEWQDDRPQMSKPPISINTEPTAFGRLNTAIETANRLFQVLRKTHGCIAAMPGPMTLVSQIYGEVDLVDGLSALKPALVSVAEAYCMTRPDILLLIETQTSVDFYAEFLTLFVMLLLITTSEWLFMLKGAQYRTFQLFLPLILIFMFLAPIRII